MEIRSHFNLGDKAWNIYSTREELYEPCPSCTGGTVNLKDGQSLKCPRCAGKGLIVERYAHRWKVGSKYTIGQIRFEIGSDEAIEQYMCNETGVGSGTLHPISQLYKSQELAQAQVDKLNNLDKREWYCTRCRPEFDPIGYSLGFGHRDWRHCSVHENSLFVDTVEAEKLLAERNERIKKIEQEAS